MNFQKIKKKHHSDSYDNNDNYVLQKASSYDNKNNLKDSELNHKIV